MAGNLSLGYPIDPSSEDRPGLAVVAFDLADRVLSDTEAVSQFGLAEVVLSPVLPEGMFCLAAWGGYRHDRGLCGSVVMPIAGSQFAASHFLQLECAKLRHVVTPLIDGVPGDTQRLRELGRAAKIVDGVLGFHRGSTEADK